MWVLSHIKTGRRFYLLSNTKKYSVGRVAQCDLHLSEDASISRDHAVIHRSSSGVRIEDTGSKYGVFVNNDIEKNKPIEKKTLVELQIGNIVRFGRLENTFRLENIDVRVCTSTMQPENIEHLKKQLKLIDGHLEGGWSTDCTHLVMNNVTVTVKVLQSLAYGLPIVTPEYFDEFIKFATEHRPELPDVKNFVPPITEPFIVKEPGMMEVHLDRQRLFQNKTFVFMIKRHMERYIPIISLAAGKCINMETEKIRKSHLLRNDHIVVLYTPTENSQCSSDVSHIEDFVISHDRRCINESEIGLAIIHRSTERFCNPDRKLTTEFTGNKSEIAKVVLQGETPNPSSESMKPASSVVVPETIDLDTEPNNNVRHDEVIDLDKPSTSSPKRVTRSSKGNDDVFQKPMTPKKKNVTPQKKQVTPQKNPKRKHDEPIDHGDSITNDSEQSNKKQKTVDDSDNQGESSAHFTDPLPSQSQSQNSFNLTGFVSTQKRLKKTSSNVKATTKQDEVKTASQKKEIRKRALDTLADDSDEENEGNDKRGGFAFNQKAKKSKVEVNPTNKRKAGSDDDDDDGFNFAKTQKPSQPKAKKTQQNSSAKDVFDSGSVSSFKVPFQTSQNRTLDKSFKIFKMEEVDFISATPRTFDWKVTKIKKEPSFDASELSESSEPIQVKSEVKLEEWEMNEDEKKRDWIQSLATAVTNCKIEVNLSRRSIDVTDSRFSESESSMLNSSNNVKRFKKKYPMTRTSVVVTIPEKVEVSAYARV